jgi:hypothetical protein
MFPKYGTSNIEAFQRSTQSWEQDDRLDEVNQSFPTQHIDIDEYITSPSSLCHGTNEMSLQQITILICLPSTNDCATTLTGAVETHEAAGQTRANTHGSSQLLQYTRKSDQSHGPRTALVS